VQLATALAAAVAAAFEVQDFVERGGGGGFWESGTRNQYQDSTPLTQSQSHVTRCSSSSSSSRRAGRRRRQKSWMTRWGRGRERCRAMKRAALP